MPNYLAGLEQARATVLKALPVKVAMVIYKDKSGSEVRRMAAHTKLTGWFFITTADEGRRYEVVAKGMAQQLDNLIFGDHDDEIMEVEVENDSED